MLKFLCYKFQLIFQNIANMINYNHSLTHVMHSLLSCARWPIMTNDYEALAIEMWLWLPSHLGLQCKVWHCVHDYRYNNKEQLLVYYYARNNLKTLFLLPMWTSLPMPTLLSSKWNTKGQFDVSSSTRLHFFHEYHELRTTINNTRCHANTNNGL